MAYARFELALGAALAAAGALATAAALAQAPAPPRSPQYPPTATITTPGYPALGPADSKLRVTGLPNGKKVHLLPATLETTQWGWFDNAQPPVLRVQFRRHHRHGDDDAQPQSGGAGNDHRADQEAAHRLPRPRAAHAHRPDLHRRSRARRRAQGDAEQDRAARLCDELQRPGHVRRIPHHLPGRPSQVPLSRPRDDDDGIPARRRSADPAVPRDARRRPQGARPLFERAARRIRRQHGHPRFRRGTAPLRAGACPRRAAVDRRLPRRPGQRRDQPHRHGDRLQGVQHYGGGAQGPAARLSRASKRRSPGSPWAWTRTSTRRGPSRRRRP